MYERCCGIFGQDLVKYTKNFKTNLYNSIENQIKKGLNTFLIGVNGGFNKIALNTCRNFCSIYPNIKIKLVITNANPFLSTQEYKKIYKIYKNEEIILFTTENIENEKTFFQTNKFIEHFSSNIICYLDTNDISNKRFIKNHLSHKNVINLFKK